MSRSFRVDINAPVTLGFVVISLMVTIIDTYVNSRFAESFFAVGPSMSVSSPLDYFQLVSHIFGHSGFQHLFGNLFMLLLLGPILEEKYGTNRMILLIVLTAAVTGILNVLFFPHGLMGASGIVFMTIILASIVNLRENSIPLTFILVFCLFIGGEVIKIFEEDNISQMAHIIGGLCGAFAGFKMR